MSIFFSVAIPLSPETAAIDPQAREGGAGILRGFGVCRSVWTGCLQGVLSPESMSGACARPW